MFFILQAWLLADLYKLLVLTCCPSAAVTQWPHSSNKFACGRSGCMSSLAHRTRRAWIAFPVQGVFFLARVFRQKAMDRSSSACESGFASLKSR